MLEHLLQVAEETAVAAGTLAHEKYRHPLEISNKGFRDVVTDADFATQAHVTDRIRARFPTHGFLTEEDDSALANEGNIIWIIDPIDGTVNYSRGVPVFCVSLAAVRCENGSLGEALAGAIYDPLRDELFSAARGMGMRVNGRVTHASPVGDLQSCLLSFDWSHSREQRARAVDAQNRLAREAYGLRCFGSAALALAWVAAGRCDAYLNYHLLPWDLAAGALLIEEAGGRFTQIDGSPAPWRREGIAALGSNGRVHDALLVQVNAAP